MFHPKLFLTSLSLTHIIGEHNLLHMPRKLPYYCHCHDQGIIFYVYTTFLLSYTEIKRIVRVAYYYNDWWIGRAP